MLLRLPLEVLNQTELPRACVDVYPIRISWPMHHQQRLVLLPQTHPGLQVGQAMFLLALISLLHPKLSRIVEGLDKQ